MAIHLGAAYVDIVPSTRELGRDLSGMVSDIGKAGDKAGRGFGTRFSEAVGSMVSASAAATGAAAGAVLGASLAKGFGRLKAIDEARFKLQGLGHDAGSVERIMDSALAAVEGTAYGLGEAATIAASAVAAGIKPGEELTRYIGLIGDTATIAGSSLAEIGGIINGITTTNQVYRRDLLQLANQGLPVFEWLQDAYGVTADELNKMVSDGAVDSATFLQAIEDNIGGAALAAGDSWSGMVANIGAAMGRLGEKILLPFFDAAKQLAPTVMELFNELGGRVETFMASFSGSGAFERFVDTLANADISGFVDKMSEFVPVISAIAGFVGASGLGGLARVVPGLGGLAGALNPVVAAAAALALSLPDVREALMDLGREIGPVVADIASQLAPILMNIADLAAEVLPGAISIFGTALTIGLEAVSGLLAVVEPLTRFLADHAEIVKVVAVSYGIWKAAMIASSAWSTFIDWVGKAKTAVKDFGAGLSGSATEANGAAGKFGASAGKFALLTGAVALGTYAWQEWNAPARRAAANLKDLTDRAVATGDAMGALREKLALTWAFADGGFEMSGLLSVREGMDGIGVSVGQLAVALEEGGASLGRIQGLLVDKYGMRGAGLADELGKIHDQGQQAADTAAALADAQDDLGLSADKNASKLKAMTGVLGGVTTAGDKLSSMFADKASEVAAATEEIERAGERAGESFRGAFDILSAEIKKPADVAEFYRGAVAGAETFGENYRIAIEAGYNPTLMSRLLAAGPEKAGELLGILASDTSQAFVDMVNDGEAALAEMEALVVNQARLTQMVIDTTGADGQRMAELLSLAVAMSTASMESGTKQSVEVLAAYTGRSVAEVREAARLFDIEVWSLRDRVAAILGMMNTAIRLSQVMSPVRLPVMPVPVPRVEGGRASGGPVWPGTWLVGEEGPELLTLGQRGHVLNARDTSALLAGGSTRPVQSVTVNMTVEGNVWAEKQLAVAVKDHLNRMQSTSTVPLLPGVSG